MEITPNPGNQDDPPDQFLTLARAAESELKVQRSRFLALAFPVDGEHEAKERLDKAARRYHDARHVCFGFRLGLGRDSISRRSDDGEPSGSAGEPILAAIDKLGLTDALVIVVRYFGGIKLGTGGLARAYGQAAGLVLTEAGLREVPLGREFVLRFPYSMDKTVRKQLETRGGKLLGQDYGEEVTWRIWLPHSVCRGFSAAVTELSAGSVTMEEQQD